jgi:hypothetical protein
MLRTRREKLNELREINEELHQALGDVGITKADQYIDAPPSVVDAPAAATTDKKPAAGSIEAKASIDTEELRGLLNSITYNVKVIQDIEPSEGNKVSINADELRSVLDSITYSVKLAQGESDGESNKIAIDEGILENILNRITYNVKIAHDDSDKESNKIAINEAELEGVLQKVFSGVLNNEDKKDKPRNKKEPWALEKTLNTTIKGILDQIQNNTSKKEWGVCSLLSIAKYWW